MMDEADFRELMAYVDGELDAAAARAFEARLAGDAEFGRMVEREHALRRRLASAYQPVLEEPIPASLSALLAGTAVAPATSSVIDLDKARSARAATRALRRPASLEWAELAAAVVLATALGFVIGRQGSWDAPLLASGADDTWRARGALDAALTRRLAAESGDGPIRVGLSFAARDGGYCRAFAVAGPRASAGLACGGADGWRIVALAPTEPAPSSASFRTAASAWPASVIQAIDALKTGDMLDAAAEQQARDRGWRR